MEEQQLTKRERRELRRQEKLNQQQQRERMRLTKRILLWFFVLTGIGGGIFGLTKLPNNPVSDVSVNTASTSDWTKGNKEAKVILIEYSDFQCPACGAYTPILKQLNQEFGDKILLVYRHFPLPNHRNAEPAARAAEAAGQQGKFWEMHDLIFANQKAWSDKQNAKDDFLKFAESLGLDLEKFKSDFTSRETRDKIRGNYQSGIKAGVNATPTFFLNGKKLQNPRTYDELKKLIQDVIPIPNGNDEAND